MTQVWGTLLWRTHWADPWTAKMQAAAPSGVFEIRVNPEDGVRLFFKPSNHEEFFRIGSRFESTTAAEHFAFRRRYDAAQLIGIFKETFDENPRTYTRRRGRFRFVGWLYTPEYKSVDAVFEDPEEHTGFFAYTNIGQHGEASEVFVSHREPGERWVDLEEAERLDPSTVSQVVSLYGDVPGVRPPRIIFKEPFDENPVLP